MSPRNLIQTITGTELALLSRERTLYILLAIFFVMATASTLIGYSTIHTITNVYNAAVTELASLGRGAPPFPIHNTSLSIMTNMIVYVTLIGSLVAIVLGYLVGIHDKLYTVTKLIFTRPVTRNTLFTGKLLSVVTVVGLMVLIAFIVSSVSLMIFGAFSLGAVGQVALFYLLSFVYLLGFSFVALALALSLRNPTSAMLYGLFLWMIVTFALPELGSALYPTSSLNPVLPPSTVTDSSLLSLVHTVTYPFSVSEHYKTLSGTTLGIPTATDAVVNNPSWVDLAIVLIWSLVGFLLAQFAFTRSNVTEEITYE